MAASLSAISIQRPHFWGYRVNDAACARGDPFGVWAHRQTNLLELIAQRSIRAAKIYFKIHFQMKFTFLRNP